MKDQIGHCGILGYWEMKDQIGHCCILGYWEMKDQIGHRGILGYWEMKDQIGRCGILGYWEMKDQIGHRGILGYWEMSLISSRIRAARSHESLLSNPSAMQAVDVTGRDAKVKAVHASMVSRDHCFHIATSQGSKFISCGSAQERDQWLDSLRRTKRPNQDHARRSDSSLKLWIVEAKHLPPKKRYFCEILLDHTAFAYTSCKPMAEMLFWGEQFEFKDLPAVETITVRLYKEVEKKKKKERNIPICYVDLKVSDISNKQFLEKWFPAECSGVTKSSKEGKGEVPLIRMKVRHQTVRILPKEFYQQFSKYLTTDCKQLCDILEPQLSLREKDEFATTLIHALHKLGIAKTFLYDIVISEISSQDDEHLTFRGNSIATKAMEAYMKLVGERYLHDTLGDFVRGLLESEEDCEVDPAKVSNATLHTHQASLEACAAKVWDRIITSSYAFPKVITCSCPFPSELREVFSGFRGHCCQRRKEELSDNLISASIFLRFLCPAILSPSLFNITKEYPSERAARNLTLIAKTIQTLANFTRFGGKEEFMTFLNGFIEREAIRMKNFLRIISSEESDNQFLQYEGFVDLERELSVLHTMLLDYTRRSPQVSQKLPGLLTILTSISDALEDPSVGQHQASSSRRSHLYYDNMPTSTSNTITASAFSSSVHPLPDRVRSATLPGGTPSPRYSDTSPTEALREMLRQCGEPEEDLHTFAARTSLKNGRRETESMPADLSSLGQCHTPPNSTKSSLNLQHSLDKSQELSEEFSALYSSVSSKYSQRSGGSVPSEVTDVSVTSAQPGVNADSVNESWNHTVSAADDSVYGDYIDLIPFIDEEGQNSSSEMDCPATANSSQMSISQLSNVASSGYQSFGYSQSSSPVDPLAQHGTELPQEVTRFPIIHYPPHPLSFANPLYRHQQLSQHHRRPPSHHHHTPPPVSKLAQVPKDCGEGVRGAEGNSGDKGRTPQTASAATALQPSVDPLRKLSQLSSSSGSNESLNGQSSLDKAGGGRRGVGGRREGGGGVVAHFTQGSRGSSPAQAHSSPRTERFDNNSHSGGHPLPPPPPPPPPPEVPPRPHRLLSKLKEDNSSGPPPAIPPRPERTSSYCDSSEQRHLGARPYHLSHSMDFGCMQRQHAQPLTRTATDSGIVKTSTPVHMQQAGGAGANNSTSSPRFSRENSFSSVHSAQSQGSLSSRRLSPQSAVHMGISSVQRKLQEQERTKQEVRDMSEYENEVHVLRQQLVEAQMRLQSAEMRLMDHEVDTHSLMEEWQSRLAESEQRIRQQQAEKDGQMKSIIERLVTIEEELRREQAEMQKVVHEKQQVIEVQEQRIRTLDNANSKLLKALADLREHASTTTVDDSNNNNNTNSGGGGVEGGRRGSSSTPHNGLTGPLRPKLTPADFAGFKSSTC
ncbi:hypothetical protein ACOMHN_035464 [Nucella lapillus]